VAGTSVVTVQPTAQPTAGVAGAQKTVSRSAPARPSGVAPLQTTRRTGTLPFTGIQLTIFALVGLGLIAGGILLRTTGRRRMKAKA
jgi:hypothetical protein